jgi:hypothetical protein
LVLLVATALIFCVFIAVNFYPHEDYRGLWIYLVGSRVSVDSMSVRSDGIVVHVRRGKTPKSRELWIDNSVVPEGSLRSALQVRLKDRPGWFVYVEGDPNLEFDDVARVIDVAAGVSAKVVLVLPSDRRLHRR